MLVALAWTLFGIMSSAHFFVREEAGAAGVPFSKMLTTIVVFYWVWAAITPAAIGAARLARRAGWRGWMLLLVLAPVLVVVHGMIYLSVAGFFGADASGSIGWRSLQAHLVRHGTGGLATVALIYGVYLFIDAHRRARERELAAAELATRLAQTELEILRWQLHPHFLFNALNTVSTLVLRGAANEAEDAINQISHYLRSALSQRAEAMVSVADELKAVQQYVDIEVLRFGQSLHVTSQLTADALHVRIPALLLQPLVENAIRYGAPDTRSNGTLNGNGRGTIVISGEVSGARLRLSVADSGNGSTRNTKPARNDGGGAGFGLAYVEQRLGHFYGNDAFLLLNTTAQGTTVVIDLPIAPPVAPSVAAPIATSVAAPIAPSVAPPGVAS